MMPKEMNGTRASNELNEKKNFLQDILNSNTKKNSTNLSENNLDNEDKISNKVRNVGMPNIIDNELKKNDNDFLNNMSSPHFGVPNLAGRRIVKSQEDNYMPSYIPRYNKLNYDDIDISDDVKNENREKYDTHEDDIRENLRTLKRNDNFEVSNVGTPSNLIMNYDSVFKKDNKTGQVVDITNKFIKNLFYNLIDTYNDIIESISINDKIQKDFDNCENDDKKMELIYSEIRKKAREIYSDVSVYNNNVDTKIETIIDFFKYCFNHQNDAFNKYITNAKTNNLDFSLIQMNLRKSQNDYLNSDISKYKIIDDYIRYRIDDKSTRYEDERQLQSKTAYSMYRDESLRDKTINKVINTFINECNNAGILAPVDESEENVKHLFKETLYMNNTIPYLKLNWDEDERLLQLFTTIIGTRNSANVNAPKSYFNNPINIGNAYDSIASVSRRYIEKSVMNNGLLNLDTESHFHSNLRNFENDIKEWAINNLWNSENKYGDLNPNDTDSSKFLEAFKEFKDTFQKIARNRFFDVEDFCNKLTTNDINMLKEATKHDINKASEDSFYTTGGTVLGEEIELLLAKNSPYYHRLMHKSKRGRMKYIEALRKNLRKFAVRTPIYNKNNDIVDYKYGFTSYNGVFNDGIKYILEADNIVNEKIKDQKRLEKLAADTNNIMKVMRKIRYKLLAHKKKCKANYERQLKNLDGKDYEPERKALINDEYKDKMHYIESRMYRYEQLYNYYNNISQKINEEGLKLSKYFCCCGRKKNYTKLLTSTKEEYKGVLKNSITYKNTLNHFKNIKKQKLNEIKNYFITNGVMVNKIEKMNDNLDKFESLLMRVRKIAKISKSEEEFENTNTDTIEPSRFKYLYDSLGLDKDEYKNFDNGNSPVVIGRVLTKIKEIQLRLEKVKNDEISKITQNNLTYKMYEDECKHINNSFNKMISKIEYDFYENNSIDRNAIYKNLDEDLKIRMKVLNTYNKMNKNVATAKSELIKVKKIDKIIEDELKNNKKNNISNHDYHRRNFVRNYHRKKSESSFADKTLN